MRDAIARAVARLLASGRVVEATTLAQRALAHDPAARELRRGLLAALVAGDRCAEAVELGHTWLAEASDAGIALEVARALARLDRAVEAADVLDAHARDVRGGSATTEAVGEALAAWVRAGRLDEGLGRLDGWIAREPGFESRLGLIAPIAAEVARYYVGVGDFPLAARFVAEALRLGLRRTQILSDADLRRMRGFRQFEDLLTLPSDPDDEDPEENGAD